MKHFVTALILLLFIHLTLSRCANPKSPTGGPKDTIPPTLISSYPIDQQLKFSDQSITLTFDEKINADKLKQNLVITPLTEWEYKSLVKKQSITIKFDQQFEDSTTYTFNFFDGVTDLTENNPVSNLILAFSTGEFIDSVKVFGTITDLFFGKPVDKMTVGLYKLTDSLSIDKVKPTYFSTTNKTGNFLIQNIKTGRYLLFAFLDKNRNLLFDPSAEAYAIYSDTLNLIESNQDSLHLKSVEINAAPLTLISARPTGLYFEIRYTKPVIHYSFINPDSIFIPSKIVGENNETLRIYKFSIKDSLRSIIKVQDSLANYRIDTVYIKFRESSRKPQEFKATLNASDKSSVFENTRFYLDFNKPTTLLDSNFTQILFDTIFKTQIQPQEISFNYNRTQLKFRLDISKAFLEDEIENYLNKHIIDTTLNVIDSSQLIINNKITRFPTDKFYLDIIDGALSSYEQDTVSQLGNNYKFGSLTNYGIITIHLQSQDSSYKVQLMKNKEIVKTMWNCTTCRFERLSPGDYWVRILIDSNRDGYWHYGNYFDLSEPEPIIYFPETTTLRSNWEVELDYSF